jgi:hypothetical protein
MELTPEQLLILGLVVVLITQVVKWVVVWFKVEQINKTILSIAVFVVSLILAVVWIKPTFPTNWTDFVTALSETLVIATALFGMAKIIYEWLIGRILDAISSRTGVPLNTASILERKLPPLGPA